VCRETNRGTRSRGGREEDLHSCGTRLVWVRRRESGGVRCGRGASDKRRRRSEGVVGKGVGGGAGEGVVKVG